jgi:uncharacterized membrane protein YjfL (UPF0719 family)
LGNKLLEILIPVGLTIGWTLLGIILLYSGVRLYDVLDPIDYRAEIRKGNIAAGLIIATIILAITAIIVSVIIT